MCCKLMGVKSIGKAAHSRCPHVAWGKGCGIYAERPGECREFLCQWLKWPQLGPEWRPDKAGFVMCLEDGGKRLRLEVDSGRPSAWKRAPYYAQLKQWARFGKDRDLTIQVWSGDRSIYVTGGADLDMGLARSVKQAAEDLKQGRG
jgi:hypothetical protein